MKALTVRQPWAQLIVLGLHPLHIRPWRTRYRGAVTIHAGLAFDENMRERCLAEPLRGIFLRNGLATPADLPRGAFVGTVRLTDCVPRDRLLHERSGVRLESTLALGQWAWMFADAHALDCPIRYRGELGLFDVPIARLLKQMQGKR